MWLKNLAYGCQFRLWAVFISRDNGYVTDDHLPVNKIIVRRCRYHQHQRQYPTGFASHWHTDDNMDIINRGTLKVGTNRNGSNLFGKSD